MNQQRHQQPKRMPQSVVEDIDAYLTEGMPVYDKNDEKVGEIKMYSTAAGYLLVGTGAFEHKDLYIPFRLIRSIDPHDLFVSESKDTLISQYTKPPTISTVVEHQRVPGPNGTTAPQTREAQVVQSGYDDDGTPAVFNCVDLSNVADRLAVGMVVYDVNGERLGDLTTYDTSRSLMVVEKGILKPQVLLVPFSAIQDIHPARFIVYLSLPRAALLEEHSMLPADA